MESKLLCGISFSPPESMSIGVCLQAPQEVVHAHCSTALLNGLCAKQHPTPVEQPFETSRGCPKARRPSCPKQWRCDCAPPMKDAVAMHVVHRFEQLPHVALGALLRHVVAAPPNQLVDVHVHQLKHKGQAPCRLVTAPERAGDRAELWCQRQLPMLISLKQGPGGMLIGHYRQESRSWCRTEPMMLVSTQRAGHCCGAGRGVLDFVSASASHVPMCQDGHALAGHQGKTSSDSQTGIPTAMNRWSCWLSPASTAPQSHSPGRQMRSLEHFQELDDVLVGGQSPQRLDLAQVVHLQQ